jgi:hypothetical protein
MTVEIKQLPNDKSSYLVCTESTDSLTQHVLTDSLVSVISHGHKRQRSMLQRLDTISMNWSVWTTGLLCLRHPSIYEQIFIYDKN